jgi:hypothetical protein
VVLRVIAACAVLLFASPAYADWRGAQWGMTPEQVAQAMNGEAPLTGNGKRGKAIGLDRPGNSGQFDWDGEKFDVKYIFDEAGLSKVALEPKRDSKAACLRLVERVEKERGPALILSDQVLLKLVIWHDKPAQNRVRILILGDASSCTAYYERLSEYEEHDLKNPGYQFKPPVPAR